MPQLHASAIKDLLCNNYKKRMFREYRGFTMSALRLLIEDYFPGFMIKIYRNNKELRFDIYLNKVSEESGNKINIKDLEHFRDHYGKGFNIILLEQSEEID